ncbi:MAG: PAP2 family protein [Methanobacterium sp.]|nr:PAP2 family protein [Methanobacterium sp.]
MSRWNNSLKYKEYLANTISTVSNAPIIAIIVFALINYYFLKGNEYIMVTSISLIFATIIPSIIAFLWVKYKKLEIDMPRKEDRFYPLLWILSSYLLGVIILLLISAPPITTILMFCYFSNTLVVLIISLFWKISIHSVGVAGPVAALIYVFGYVGLIALILIPLVMWSRLYLRRHTLFQVIVGALLGFILTIVQIYFFI